MSSQHAQDLLKRVKKASFPGGIYNEYLHKIVLEKIRGFKNVEITFDFPVTALIGANGSGKSTVLGAAALAYKMVPPRRFFPKSPNFDKDMHGWRIRYSIINKGSSMQRTASFREQRWKRSSPLPDRKVAIFGISRTVPASEQLRFLKFARNDAVDSNALAKEELVTKHLFEILGISSEYEALYPEEGEGVDFLVARKPESSIAYSEFHFGAGESSLARMILTIHSLPKESLILIEEVENGLHPIAVTRFVEYLLEVAKKKNHQVIFTTHSSYALDPLPDIAVWALIEGRAAQGKIDIQVLRRLFGKTPDEVRLVVFVEDKVAQIFLKEIARSDDPDLSQVLDIYPVSGQGNVKKLTKAHNENPSVKKRAIGFLDGDAKTPVDDGGIYKLPGTYAPEKYLLSEVLKAQDSGKAVIEKIAANLRLNSAQANKLAEELKKIPKSIDPHKIPSKIAHSFGLEEEDVIKAFAFTWATEIDRQTASKIRKILEDNLQSL